MDVQSATIEVPTPDGPADATFAAPVTGRHPAVLLYMDAFGLRDRITEMAAHLAAEGYAVLAPNVFHRQGPAPLVDLTGIGEPGRRAEVFERLRPLMTALTPEAAVRDASAYLDFLAADPHVLPGPVGTVGYCMGGALAFRTAAAHPDRVAAVASFHGGRLATDAPDSPHLLAGRITADVYVGHADHDVSMPPEAQRTLEQALTDAGVRHTCELYDGAAHGFTMADTPAYDEQATERHWDRLLDLLRRTLHP